LGSGRKCKAQYFQHDNREYIAKYESFHFTSTGTQATTTTAAALNYAAVAKKFKPLRPPVLASGAKKNRRTAQQRKPHNDCACVCQSSQSPAMTQCPQEEKQTADASQWERERELKHTANNSTQQSKINNINGNKALPALLELLKHSSSTWLETLLLGAGSAAVAR